MIVPTECLGRTCPRSCVAAQTEASTIVLYDVAFASDAGELRAVGGSPNNGYCTAALGRKKCFSTTVFSMIFLLIGLFNRLPEAAARVAEWQNRKRIPKAAWRLGQHDRM